MPLCLQCKVAATLLGDTFIGIFPSWFPRLNLSLQPEPLGQAGAIVIGYSQEQHQTFAQLFTQKPLGDRLTEEDRRCIADIVAGFETEEEETAPDDNLQPVPDHPGAAQARKKGFRQSGFAMQLHLSVPFPAPVTGNMNNRRGCGVAGGGRSPGVWGRRGCGSQSAWGRRWPGPHRPLLASNLIGIPHEDRGKKMHIMDQQTGKEEGGVGPVNIDVPSEQYPNQGRFCRGPLETSRSQESGPHLKRLGYTSSFMARFTYQWEKCKGPGIGMHPVA
ncbi:hypothetical protein LXA43DRAFT_1066253 [Ganoderma leucocontextum]|nr:hypothetical protein LXA43DRAFT_1066253 [Ganoderma leucocontextum]